MTIYRHFPPIDRWLQACVQAHAEGKRKRHLQRLRHFRFRKAHGGHANDGDTLTAVFACSGMQQLDTFLGSLGIALVKFDSEPPQAAPGLGYTDDVFAQFPELIAGTAWIKQPGHCQIMGINTYVWCGNSQVRISVNDQYSVSDKNIHDAAIIEKRLAQIVLPA